MLLFFPQAAFSALVDLYELDFFGISHITAAGKETIINVWFLAALEAIIPVISLITIFLYKKRVLQIRLTFINIILNAGVYAMLFIYILTAAKTLQADWNLNIVTAFPLVNIVLSSLIIRAIGKDIALVKSLNRLR
jgi:hypothetical protein